MAKVLIAMDLDGWITYMFDHNDIIKRKTKFVEIETDNYHEVVDGYSMRTFYPSTNDKCDDTMCWPWCFKDHDEAITGDIKQSIDAVAEYLTEYPRQKN